MSTARRTTFRLLVSTLVVGAVGAGCTVNHSSQWAQTSPAMEPTWSFPGGGEGTAVLLGTRGEPKATTAKRPSNQIAD